MVTNPATGREYTEAELARETTQARPAFDNMTPISVMLDSGMSSVNTFPTDDKMLAWKLTSIACSPAGSKRDKDSPDPIEIYHYYCHRVELVNDKTGEILAPTRVCFISKDDRAVAFVSDSIVRELDTIRSIFGDGPYVEPKMIRVKSVDTRKGNRIYVVEPA